ncbi:NAD(P)/FAD-dependent oxidoreductase [Rhizobium alvei]|uniref:FAD-binding oxidoreductase n=1 Tax=Rhizobium alvei TaxID=1132659 RepID=A0ABT8YPF4_9HYPH|nr:FAD-binding oxidoreductase [Rhizobium alvei]MDO6965391.1 FAD-binding oxidoreductase [Rhizobium alvei]
MNSPHIIVIGGGIIGASIAWHLADAGAKTSIYCRDPGGVATPNSFAWINANWGNPEPYFHLRRRSMDRWKHLAERIPGLHPEWNGSICYDLEPEGLTRFAEEHGSWGYGLARIDRDEIIRLEPNLADLPDWALKIDEEGMIEPHEAALAFLSDAERKGAKVTRNQSVKRLILRDGRICGVETELGIEEADKVVLAAGAETAALAAAIGITIPMEASPGLLMDTHPAPPLLNHIIVAPGMEMRQAADGSIVAATSFNGTDPGEDPEQTARTLFADLLRRLKPGALLEYRNFRIGYRPMPKDGFPILGCAENGPGLYIAITHSGVTLAPAIGEIAAREILTGEDEPMLAPYRLSRFAG